MDITENLRLPYLMPSQAQKHVTHNEALRIIDALAQLAVLSKAVAAPPSGPQPGARYVVPEAATGAWAGKSPAIAAWQDGTWIFHAPKTGWLAYVVDEKAIVSFDGAGWTPATVETTLPARLGVNMTATAPNRLALAGDASLFSHEGAGHQLKVNKAGSGDTASLLFQTGYSGRAEFGLMGDDDFRLKVSSDGSLFRDAMLVSRSTGRASFPAGVTGLREQLTAHRTYHVSNGGSDANTGLSAGTAFATLQKAVDEAHKLDCSVYDVTIQLADGTYEGATIARPLTGGGMLTIAGNESTPANVVIGSSTITDGNARLTISGVKFTMSGSLQHALSMRGGVQLLLGNVDFGQMGPSSDHILGRGFGEITFTHNYTISGGARRHLNLSGLVMASSNGTGITLTGTPAFTSEFLYVTHNAVATLWDLTISGSATGRRFLLNTAGVINLYGKPADFLPGSTAGTTASGGVYA